MKWAQRIRLPFHHGKWVGLVVFLLGSGILVSTLLVGQYRGAVVQWEAADKTFLDHAKGQAAQVDYFFERVSYELSDLSERRVVTAYFSNKALGITLEYGLRISLLDLVSELNKHLGVSIAGDHSIFCRMALIDQDNKVVWDSQRPNEDPGRAWELTGSLSSNQLVKLDDYGDCLLELSPCRINGRQVGSLVGFVPMTTVWSLLEHRREENGFYNWMQWKGQVLRPSQSDPVQDEVLDRVVSLEIPMDQVLHSKIDLAETNNLPIVATHIKAGPPTLHLFQVKPLDKAVTAISPGRILAMVVLSLIGIVLGTGLIAHTKARSMLQEVEIEQREILENGLRAAKEKADQANLAKSQFLANMSHEIRTPLNGVLGMTHLTLDTDLDDEQREYLAIALESGESLLDIINDILDISRIESGRFDIESISFNLRELMETIFGTFRSSVYEKGIGLDLEIQERCPENFTSDPVRMRQVLVNLIGNAIKFTAEGRVVVTISWDEETELMVFHVQDTGIGIPAEKHATIFEAFSQADNTTTRQYGGTGLGLAISQKIAGLMDGGLSLTSEPGQGSDFRFHLPMAMADEKVLNLVE